MNNLSNTTCDVISSQLLRLYKNYRNQHHCPIKSNRLLDQHMWATGTKLKIKLIGVQVANNKKAEKKKKTGSGLVFRMVGIEKEANNLV